MFCKFVHFQLFNIKHKFVYLELVWRQVFVFRISHLSQTEGNSPQKMMTCYLRDTNKFLRCCTPCKSIKLTRFVLFDVLGVPQLWGTSVWTISVGTARKFAIYNRNDEIINFRVLDMLVTLFICSQHRVFLLPWWYFTVPQERFSQSEHMVRDACTVLRVEVIIFSWGSRDLSLIERNLKKWILFLHRRYTKMAYICGIWSAAEDIPQNTCS